MFIYNYIYFYLYIYKQLQVINLVCYYLIFYFIQFEFFVLFCFFMPFLLRYIIIPLKGMFYQFDMFPLIKNA